MILDSFQPNCYGWCEILPSFSVYRFSWKMCCFLRKFVIFLENLGLVEDYVSYLCAFACDDVVCVLLLLVVVSVCIIRCGAYNFHGNGLFFSACAFFG